MDRLDPARLYKNDPLLLLVRDRLRLPVGGVVLGYGLLTCIILLIVPLFLGVSPRLQDYFQVTLQSFGIFAIGIVVYLRLPDILAGLFNKLAENGVIAEPKDPEFISYDDFLNQFTLWADSRWWTVIAVLGIALHAVYRLFLPVEGDTTQVIPDQFRLGYRILLVADYSPLIYAGLVSLFDLLISLLFTGKLFREFRIRVNPLHPDGGGGLGVLGRALGISILIATALGMVATGIILVRLSNMSNPFARVETVALVLVYLISLPLFFTGWLWNPHRAMIEAREQALKPLADEFSRAVRLALPGAEDDAAKIKTNTDRLEEIKRQYTLLFESFPVWPLRTKALNGLVATSLLPLISSLLTSFLPNIRDAILVLFGGPQP